MGSLNIAADSGSQKRLRTTGLGFCSNISNSNSDSCLSIRHSQSKNSHAGICELVISSIICYIGCFDVLDLTLAYK